MTFAPKGHSEADEPRVQFLTSLVDPILEMQQTPCIPIFPPNKQQMIWISIGLDQWNQDWFLEGWEQSKTTMDREAEEDEEEKKGCVDRREEALMWLDLVRGKQARVLMC